MKTVGALEAKNTLADLLDLVENGEEVTITRDGKPVARLVRSMPAWDAEKARKAVEDIKHMCKGVTLGGVTIKELIEDGRK